MKVIDPGHTYLIDCYDGGTSKVVRFMKRMGSNYPHNHSSQPGTNIQELLRVCIDRIKYLQGQKPSHRNIKTVEHLRGALLELEFRHQEMSGNITSLNMDYIESYPTCKTCGHTLCENHKLAKKLPEASK